MDEDILKSNINFAALFVLNFECLKDYIITQPRTFYSDVEIRDGEFYDLYQELWKRINDITHELLKNLKQVIKIKDFQIVNLMI